MSNSNGPKSHKRIVFLEGADPMSRAACTCHPAQRGARPGVVALRACPQHHPDTYAVAYSKRRNDYDAPKGI